jgi:hypothetical protein
MKTEILSFRIIHTNLKRHYFDWHWDMIWILLKYKLFWGMRVSMTVTKACDREEYRVQFYAE